MTLSISNSGNIITPGNTTVALFATTGGTIDDTSTQIAALTKRLKIKPAKSSKVTVTLKLLPTLAAGSYAIVAQVTDPDRQVTTVSAGSMTITG